MTGLVETCTHVAALLFWVEMVIKIHNSKTITDKQAYWVPPSNLDTFLQPKMLLNIQKQPPEVLSLRPATLLK